MKKRKQALPASDTKRCAIYTRKSTTMGLEQEFNSLAAQREDALQRLNTWAGQPLPLNASAWREGRLYVRLAGARSAVEAAARRLGGDLVEPSTADALWQGLRDHDGTFHRRAHDAVARGQAWWRLSVPATAPPLELAGDTLIERPGRSNV